jgi:putative endopeptidase
MAFTAPVFANSAAAADAPAAKPELGNYGFDESGMDRSAEPGDNFYTYANGAWAKATEIPADKSNFGMFTKLDDLSKERVKGLLDAAARNPKSKMGVAYATFLDEAAIENKGLAPINPILKQIRGVKTHKQFEALLPKMAPQRSRRLVRGLCRAG